MENILKPHIESRILFVRESYVLLDRDLAQFYKVKSIRLREQVKRNPNRFPSDFVFQLTENEVEVLVSQNAIPSKQSLGGYLPLVFTEQGVAAVAGVLKSDKAAEVSILIARAFVSMRKFLLQNASVFQRLDSVEMKLLKAEDNFNKIFKAIEIQQPKPDKGVFYDGQIFDAYLFVADIIKSAKLSLILIDNYIDESVLHLLSKRGDGVSATIYTASISPLLSLDIQKHNSQYPPIGVRLFSRSHDRFLIVDEMTVYHIGASLKDLGKRWFAFSKIELDVVEIVSKLFTS